MLKKGKGNNQDVQIRNLDQAKLKLLLQHGLMDYGLIQFAGNGHFNPFQNNLFGQ